MKALACKVLLQRNSLIYMVGGVDSSSMTPVSTVEVLDGGSWTVDATLDDSLLPDTNNVQQVNCLSYMKVRLCNNTKCFNVTLM